MKDTYHVEAGTTATSECPIYRNGSWIGYVAPHHAKALADAFRQRDELLEALDRARQKLRAYVGVCSGDKELTGAVLPMADAAIASVKGAR